MRIGFVVPVLALCVAAPLFAENIREVTRLLRVKYGDGAVETYSVKYTANFSSDIHEEGHPSEPLKGDFTDTRKCHWSANASVERQACLVNHAGRTICPAELTRVYNASQVNQGAGGWSFERLQPENCGDARPRAGQEIDNARASLLAQMPGIIAQDREAFRQELSKDAQVVSLDDVSSDRALTPVVRGR